MRSQRLIRVLLAAIGAVLLILASGLAVPALAHDFGGPTGPGGPPPPDGCPGCCGPGGGGGGPCGGGGPGCGAPGDPVNVWDGSERHDVVDVRFAGYFPFELSRTYDSRVDYDSPMGYGWAHSYDLRAFRSADGSVMLRRTCGGRRLFVPSGGGFVSPAGEFRNTLAENGDGTLTLTESTGTQYRFDLSGRLERIQDVHGNRLELEYDPAGRLPLVGTSRFSRAPNTPGIVALDYRLTRIRERGALGALTGREITIAYNGTTGRVQTVTDHAGRTWTYSHDARGNLVSVAAPEGRLHTYTYNDATDQHNLTSVSEGIQGFTLIYDTQDRVTRQTMSGGTVWDFVYNVPSVRSTVTQTVKDPDGAVVRTATTVYEFNPYGNPTKMTDGLGNEFSYVRDAQGNTLTKEIRQNVPGTGLVLIATVALTYDAAGNASSEIHTQLDTGEVVTRTMTYDGNYIATQRLSSSLTPGVAHGYDEVYAHNAGGFPTVILQDKRIVSGGDTPTPTFHTLMNAYNGFGQLVQTTHPSGDIETLGYTDGLLTDDNGTTMTRDTRGNILTRTDPNGSTWTYAYDNLDRVTFAEDPTGTQTLFTWTGEILTQMEVGKTAGGPGKILLLTYDTQGRVTQIRRQTGAGLIAVVTMRRDSEGNALRLTDGAGRFSLTAYDAMGRTQTVTSGAGGISTFEYDAFGNLTRTTDGAGRVTRYTNWLMQQPGKPLTVRDGLDKTYTAVLYANGTLKTLTDPLGRVLTEVHDALGRLTSFSGPSGTPTTFTYNDRNLLGTRTDALGRTTTYSYNSRAELTGIDLPGPDAVALTRDPGGRITHAVDADSDLSLVYDGLGRVIQETNNLASRSVSTTYTSTGQRRTVTTSDGVTTTYDYNDLDQLVAVRRNGTPEVTHTRDNGGLVTRADYANGTYTVYTRDGAGRPAVEEARDATNTLLSRVTSTRDGSGIVTVKHEELRRPDGSTSNLFFHYTYNAALRLTREEIRASDDTTVMSARTFAYDDSGNRLTMAFDGGPTTTYAYDVAYRLQSETTGGSAITYTYDANGNILTETFGASTVTYGYDPEGRVISIDSPADAADYVLSWEGRRLAKTLDGSTTEYLYDGLNVIGEYPQGGPVVSYLLTNALDQIVARVEGAQKSYYNQLEELRSVMQMTGAGGVVQNAYVYKAFGELLESTINTPNVHTFTGRTRDAETDHLYFRERLYSARTGRFLSLDPFRPDAARSVRIGGPQRFALSARGVQDSPLFDQRRDVNVNGMDVTGYLYTGNNPVNATDPTGEVILWNPVSGSLTSGCGLSGCLGSGCGISGCGGSGCLGSGCGGSGCGGSLCGASGCGGSACAGSACGGSACLGSVCGASGCTGSVCGGSGCVGSACAGSLCLGSACGVSYCLGSGCGGSGCVGSGCGISVCGGSACIGSTCGASACIVSACFGSGCSGSGCNPGSSCTASGCTSSGCGTSGGCSGSGCSGSSCNAGSGCNSPCCK